MPPDLILASTFSGMPNFPSMAASCSLPPPFNAAASDSPEDGACPFPVPSVPSAAAAACSFSCPPPSLMIPASSRSISACICCRTVSASSPPCRTVPAVSCSCPCGIPSGFCICSPFSSTISANTMPPAFPAGGAGVSPANRFRICVYNSTAMLPCPEAAMD